MDQLLRRRDMGRQGRPADRSIVRTHEDYGIVLDFLPNGHPFEQRRLPIAQLIGIDKFSLLEVVPKKGEFLAQGEKVYIGADKRDKIHHIEGKIGFDRLTNTAKNEIESVISKLVDENSQKFIDFFNKAGPVSTRLHSLELIPGIGKKHMWRLIEEREKGEFKNFDDIKERVALIPDPKKAIIERIIEELQKKDKYSIFTS